MNSFHSFGIFDNFMTIQQITQLFQITFYPSNLTILFEISFSHKTAFAFSSFFSFFWYSNFSRSFPSILWKNKQRPVCKYGPNNFKFSFTTNFPSQTQTSSKQPNFNYTPQQHPHPPFPRGNNVSINVYSPN